MAKQEKKQAVSLEDLAKMYGVEVPKEEPIATNTYQNDRIPPFLGREKELKELDTFLKSPEKRIFGLFGAPMIGKSELTKQFLRTNEEVRKYQILKIRLIESDIENPDLTLTNELKKWDKSKPTLFVFENFEQTLAWRIGKDLHQIRTEYQEIKEFLVEIHHSKEHKIILESRFQCDLRERNIDFETLKNADKSIDLKGVDPEKFWADYEKNGVSREEFETICAEFGNHTWLLRLASDPQTFRFDFQNSGKNIAMHPQRITEKLWEILQNEILQYLEQSEDAILCALTLKSPITDYEMQEHIGKKMPMFQYTDIDKTVVSLLNKFLIADGYEINPFLRQVCSSFMQRVRKGTFRKIEQLTFFKDTKRSTDAIREAHRTGNYKVFFDWVKENRKAGKFDMVIAMLERVVWENPEPTRIINEIARTYYFAKKMDQAKALFLELTNKYDHVPAMNELAIIYRNENNLPKAKEILEKALDIEPENIKVLNELAIIYKNEGNLDKAKEILEKACALGNIHSFNELAIIYKNENNLPKAKEILEKALEINPQDVKTLNELAIIFKSEGNLKEVKRIYQKALEIEPNHQMFLNELAIIYKNEGNLDKAKEILEKACALGNIHSFNELAIIYKHEGNLDKAKEILEKALKSEPSNIHSFNELAIIYKNENNLPKAKEILEKACKMGNIQSYSELAIIYLHELDLKKALETVEKGLKIDSKNTYLLPRKREIEHTKNFLANLNLKNYMNPSIQKALSALQEANYSGYFENMDSLVPAALQTPYQEHKGKFIAGQYPWNFYQQLEIFAREVDKALQKPSAVEPSAGSSTTAEAKTSAVVENPADSLKTLYNTLNTKFNDESLNLFCMLHFDAVHNNFTNGQGKISKITALLDYAKRNDLLGRLEKDLADFGQ